MVNKYVQFVHNLVKAVLQRILFHLQAGHSRSPLAIRSLYCFCCVGFSFSIPSQQIGLRNISEMTYFIFIVFLLTFVK